MQKIYFKYLGFTYKLFDSEFINIKTTTKTYHQTINRIKKYNIKSTSDCGKFAQVKINFINVNDRYKLKKYIFLSHLNDHVRSYKLLIKKHLLNKTEMWVTINNSSITICTITTRKRKKGFL